MKITTLIDIVLFELGLFLGAFLGEVDGLLVALICFSIVDYITGVIDAIMSHELSSNVGFKGIARKVLLFTIVGIAHIMDVYVIGSQAVCRTAVIIFYIANEGLSIVENVASCGVPIPNKIKIILEQLKEEDKK